jgi:hypothetical protein
LEQFGDGGVELFAAADIIEAAQEVFGSDPGAFWALEVVEDLASVHHDDAVAEVDGLLHGVSDHQGREAVALDDFVGQPDDLVGAFGVESGCMFIEQQQFWFQP